MGLNWSVWKFVVIVIVSIHITDSSNFGNKNTNADRNENVDPSFSPAGSVRSPTLHTPSVRTSPAHSAWGTPQSEGNDREPILNTPSTHTSPPQISRIPEDFNGNTARTQGPPGASVSPTPVLQINNTETIRAQFLCNTSPLNSITPGGDFNDNNGTLSRTADFNVHTQYRRSPENHSNVHGVARRRRYQYFRLKHRELFSLLFSYLYKVCSFCNG